MLKSHRRKSRDAPKKSSLTSSVPVGHEQKGQVTINHRSKPTTSKMGGSASKAARSTPRKYPSRFHTPNSAPSATPRSTKAQQPAARDSKAPLASATRDDGKRPCNDFSSIPSYWSIVVLPMATDYVKQSIAMPLTRNLPLSSGIWGLSIQHQPYLTAVRRPRRTQSQIHQGQGTWYRTLQSHYYKQEIPWLKRLNENSSRPAREAIPDGSSWMLFKLGRY